MNPQLLQQAKDLIAAQKKSNKYDECGHSSCIAVLTAIVKDQSPEDKFEKHEPVFSNAKSNSKV